MSYCRYCGREIMYTLTANEKWLPYDVTGEPHFCNKEGKSTKKTSGLEVCKTCGKPVFKMKGKTVDYTTLEIHLCKKGDVTRYEKYRKAHTDKLTPGGAKRKRNERRK